jgi:hypothetical protein
VSKLSRFKNCERLTKVTSAFEAINLLKWFHSLILGLGIVQQSEVFWALKRGIIENLCSFSTAYSEP